MNAPPAFQFYPDDFIGGTVDLTSEDCGAYIRLLCYQWGRGAIPATKAAVDRVAGCAVTMEVMSKFPDGKNARLERVRAELISYRESCIENGKKGGNPAFVKGKANPYYAKDKAPHNPPLSFGDKGKITTPPPSPPPTPKKDSKAEPPAGNPNHQAFAKGWSEDFRKFHGFDYKFDGGKDGKSVKELMTMQIPIIELLHIAKLAWAKNREDGKFSKSCKEASTIHGFRHALNSIRVEVSNGNGSHMPPAGASTIGQKPGESFEQYEQRVLRECVQ